MPRKSNRSQAVEVLRPRIHQTWWAQFLLVIWRWWIEGAIVAGLVYVYLYLHDDMPPWAAVCVIIAPITVCLLLPIPGRWMRGWAWCMVTRHRVRAFLVENGIRNRSGKLPWILATYPTPVGERVWLLLIAGMSVDDVSDRVTALAATCWARDARLDRTKRSAAVVRVDIIRRDPLATNKPLKSTLVDKAPSRSGDSVPGEVVLAPVASVKKPPEWALDTYTAGSHSIFPTKADQATGMQAVPGKTTPSATTKPAKNKPVSDPTLTPGFVVNGEDVTDYV